MTCEVFLPDNPLLRIFHSVSRSFSIHCLCLFICKGTIALLRVNFWGIPVLAYEVLFLVTYCFAKFGQLSTNLVYCTTWSHHLKVYSVRVCVLQYYLYESENNCSYASSEMTFSFSYNWVVYYKHIKYNFEMERLPHMIVFWERRLKYISIICLLNKFWKCN